ncbi:MAG: 4-hydroxy-3-methylbut-2-en-1-yl diphosphate synthase [Cytophagales bacterium]|nr:MAG: 4-hydroxy-3-methylbut-2-en-1-yl diphosphate synthase [Cytophagales bacterium]
MHSYIRRKTHQVQIGELMLGSDYPIRVQSMTTTDTLNTEATVAQSIRMIEAGCELVRITAPSLKEAENLANIKNELHKKGYHTPLVADIHFTPNAAEVAARIVEKVRINPGNYVDKKRFEIIEYTDAQYNEEIERIRDKFIPFLKICKEYGTALRIGTNHGSLSDRIVNRYGDNPHGMVESALEFIRICEEMNFYNLVISMKSSNPQVMVQAYRLLVSRLEAENLKPYPLHLGVTEAGDGEDGRIKSAVGIGTLLEEGLGDTVRVSLTEEPEFEMPVGRKLVERYVHYTTTDTYISHNQTYTKRETHEVENVGKNNVPRVIIDFSQIPTIEMADFKAFGYTYLPLTDKWGSSDTASDFVYLGKQKVPFMMPNGLKAIQDYETWLQEPENSYPLITLEDSIQKLSPDLNFILLKENELLKDYRHLFLGKYKNCVIVLETEKKEALQSLRSFFSEVLEIRLTNPIIIKRKYAADLDIETLQLYSATDIGGLLIDGLGDGVMLSLDVYSNDKNEALQQVKALNSISFGTLQAARTRMTKTEYISCPSCGRTLFDLQETTALIRKRTDHLKGIKIGIMGCIVNGPGEMADADYGYVGSGKDKITLYRGQNVVKRSVPTAKAVDELINLIKEDGRWIEIMVEAEV